MAQTGYIQSKMSQNSFAASLLSLIEHALMCMCFVIDEAVVETRTVPESFRSVDTIYDGIDG